MKRLILVLVAVSSMALGRSPRALPVNAFTLTPAVLPSDNPISLGGLFTNGKTNGLDWQDCQLSGGFVHGATTGHASVGCASNANCDDPTSLLAGTWANDETITMVVVNNNPTVDPNNEEVECRLRSDVGQHRNVGYEINFSLTNNHYVDLEQWNFDGVHQTFVDLQFLGDGGVISTGDVIKCTMIGTVITGSRNGVQKISYDIATGNNGAGGGTPDSIQYTSGRPGIGFFLVGLAASAYADFGFSSVTVTAQ